MDGEHECQYNSDCRTEAAFDKLDQDPDLDYIDFTMGDLMCVSLSGETALGEEYEIYKCMPEQTCDFRGTTDGRSWFVECSEGAGKLFLSAATAFLAAAYAM